MEPPALFRVSAHSDPSYYEFRRALDLFIREVDPELRLRITKAADGCIYKKFPNPVDTAQHLVDQALNNNYGVV